MKNRLIALMVLAAALAAAVPAAHADGRNPASLLLFPEYDHSSGHNTLVTVTNTNVETDEGSVRLHYRYVSGVESNLCIEADRFEDLTPGDTISVLTSFHSNNPGNKGFLYVFAVGEDGEPISFNFLVGDVVQLNGTFALQHVLNPLPFVAIPPLGQPTDIDGDHVRDLDGEEYEEAPDRILIPRFHGQDASHQSDVIFVALSGGAPFTNVVDLLIFNDNEVVLSAQHTFSCWEKRSLLSISNVFLNSYLHDNTDDASNEILGSPSIEAGWIVFNGLLAYSSQVEIPDPALLVVLYEQSGTTANSIGAELPFFDGKQTNGALLPQGPQGDQD